MANTQITKPCNCEHVSHMADTLAERQMCHDAGISSSVALLGTAHPYMRVPAGEKFSEYVGPVCDECANGHLAPYIMN